MSSIITQAVRTITDYLGFYTSGSPVVTTTVDSNGDPQTLVSAAPVMYITPNVTTEFTVIADLTLGTSPSTGVTAAAPHSFNSFVLSSLQYNPPINSFTVSKIKQVVVRASPSPHDVDWYAGIWAHQDRTRGTTTRGHEAVSRRAPNVMWSWRSNLTVQVNTDHVVPWPQGKPICDSLHAVLPGLHPPALQIGFNNRPHATATGYPAQAITISVIVTLEVAGYGMLGSL